MSSNPNQLEKDVDPSEGPGSTSQVDPSEGPGGEGQVDPSESPGGGQ
jgi:hypothetical protein